MQPDFVYYYNETAFEEVGYVFQWSIFFDSNFLNYLKIIHSFVYYNSWSFHF